MEKSEIRKHIKPFLKYAIENIRNNIYDDNFLYFIADEYCYEFVENGDANKVSKYLRKRIQQCRPKDSGTKNAWYCNEDGSNMFPQKETSIKKLEWCEYQLKVVKP